MCKNITWKDEQRSERKRMQTIRDAQYARRGKGQPLTEEETKRFWEIDALRKTPDSVITEEMKHEFEGLYMVAKQQRLDGFDWTGADRGIFISKAAAACLGGTKIDPAYGFWW